MRRAVPQTAELVLIGTGPATLDEAAMSLGPQPLLASGFRGPSWDASSWWWQRSNQEILQFPPGLPSVFKLASVRIRMDEQHTAGSHSFSPQAKQPPFDGRRQHGAIANIEPKLNRRGDFVYVLSAGPRRPDRPDAHLPAAFAKNLHSVSRQGRRCRSRARVSLAGLVRHGRGDEVGRSPG